MFPWMFGGAWMIIVWIVIFGLVVGGQLLWSSTLVQGHHLVQIEHPSISSKNAIAKGKINKEEFLQIKRPHVMIQTAISGGDADG
jgi:hypothetical protein